MFLRVLGASLRRRLRRKILAAATLACGAALVTAFSALSLDIGDKMARELKAYGANLVIEPADGAPEGATLPEADLPLIAGTFWRNNVLGISPFLPVAVRAGGAPGTVALVGTWFDRPLGSDADARQNAAGVRSICPWWKVEGAWPRDSAPIAADDSVEAVVGTILARERGWTSGKTIVVSGPGSDRLVLHVTGILTTGGPEDGQILAPIAVAQRLSGLSGRYARALVSALTTPENELFRKYLGRPEGMPVEDLERWSCTPYPSTVAHQLGSALPGSRVRVLHRVAETEGVLLTRVQRILGLITLGALLAAFLGVLSTTTSTVIERTSEIGLWKAMGASSGTVALLFLAESACIALLGGFGGLVGGMATARGLSVAIFGTTLPWHWELAPIVMTVTVLLGLLGSAAPLRRIADVAPAVVLRSGRT